MNSSSQTANEGGNAEEQLVCVSKGADAGRRPGDKQMPSKAGVRNEPFVPVWELCCREHAACRFN